MRSRLRAVHPARCRQLDQGLGHGPDDGPGLDGAALTPAASIPDARAACGLHSPGGTGRAAEAPARPAWRRHRARREVGWHDVEAVGGAALEPCLQLVGHLGRCPDDAPMAARAGEVAGKLSDGKAVATRLLDDQRLPAFSCLRSRAVRATARRSDSAINLRDAEITGQQRHADIVGNQRLQLLMFPRASASVSATTGARRA